MMIYTSGPPGAIIAIIDYSQMRKLSAARATIYNRSTGSATKF